MPLHYHNRLRIQEGKRGHRRSPTTLIDRAVPVGALAGEAALGVMLMGKLFERLDLSSESVS